ncbi:MAG: heparan-alpha-glucosaminide N-acetyltransferase domain-containing protein [Bryobacteraceae bacterium]
MRNNRLMSLDVFRGVTIASMILVNNPGKGSAAYAPLHHAGWHGWTFTDLVFPFFLWIAGVAMTLSFSARIARGESRSSLALHTLRRCALLFAIPLLMGAFPHFQWDGLRIPGVLQRIAVCCLIAAVIYLTTSLRGRVFAILFLLAVYWILMTLVPVPGFGPGVLTKEGNFARYIDGLFLTGHMYANTKTWDPEGIVSTIPAIATVLFGILAGELLRTQRSEAEKTAWLFLSGNVLLLAGSIMDVWLPVNKSLWTSSYAVFMAGMASIVFAGFYLIVDVQGLRRWARPFAIYGMNAIALYVLSGALAHILSFWKIGGKSMQSILYDLLFAPLASPASASLLWSLTEVAFFFAVALLMYRRKWFVRP